LRDRGWRKYLWLDVQALCRKLLKPDQNLVLTKYFSARISGPPDKQMRQESFLGAVGTLPEVQSYFGKYQVNTQHCFACKACNRIPSEKMTDVNIATEMLTDAFRDRFDVALLISADSDLRPPIEAILREFPNKRVVVAFPPKRSSKELKQVAHGFVHIGEDKIRQSQFPDIVTRNDGFLLQKPREWNKLE
jgi:uncharacterized LabA/DUF88 family protein